ncbi:hypothetical protein MMC10_001998 [Thelotrema lepadinum]|nr:hypothetical protein [Thelotrema lepadinum]
MRHLYTLAASAITLTSLLSSAAAYPAESSIYARQAPSLYDLYNALNKRDASPYAFADPYADPYAEPGFWNEVEDVLLDTRMTSGGGKAPKGTPGQSSSKTNPTTSNSNLGKEFGPNLPAPVNVNWFKGNRPKKPSQAGARQDAEQKTQQAADHENRTNPPVSPGGTTHVWTDATIKHGFGSDSTQYKDQAGKQGDAAPHVNAAFKASNGFVSTKHVGTNGRVRPNHRRDVYLRAARALVRRAMVEG